MLFSHALLLALIQGATEFLPVSSTAHLLALEYWLQLPQDLAFNVMVHAGTLVAVIVYCRRDLFQLRNTKLDSGNVLVLIAMASLPIFIVGFLLYDWLDAFSFHDSYPWVAAASILFALLLWGAHYCKPYHPTMTLGRALLIGLAQVLALLPGASRAGVVLTAGLFLGLQREYAARFSFLLAVPTIAGASLLQLFELWLDPTRTAVAWPVLLFSFAVSTLTALLSMHFFIAFLKRLGLIPFVVYRLVFGVFIVVLFL